MRFPLSREGGMSPHVLFGGPELDVGSATAPPGLSLCWYLHFVKKVVLTAL